MFQHRMIVMARKPRWFFKQSAVVPYLWQKDEVHIVLVTTSSSGKWTIPKGIVERDLTPAESAAKEAEEEAGVLGKLDEKVLCEYKYRKWGGTCRVKVYPLLVTEVLSTWDEDDVRERVVVPLEEAVEIVKPVLMDVLQEFQRSVSDLVN